MLKRKLEEISTDRRRTGHVVAPEWDGATSSAIKPPAGGARPSRPQEAMRKTKLGTKRQCQACGGRLYDLGKRPVICPHCGAEVDLERVKRTRERTTRKAEPRRRRAPPPRPIRG